MARWVAILLTVVALGWSAARLTAAQNRETAPDRQSFTTATTAILVDVVVRNHRGGRPVTDLNSEAFSVFEDGAPQKIDTFSRVTRGGGIGVDVRWKPPGTTQVVTPLGGPPPVSAGDEASDHGATALVFDHLSEDALHLAQRATLEYVPMSGESDLRVAVFATEPHVTELQTYTTDRAAIRKAVADLMPTGSAARDQTAERRQQVVDRRRELMAENQALVAASTTGAGGAQVQNSAPRGQTESELQLLQLERSMIDSFDSLDRDYKGYDTTMSLVSVIRSLAEMPGRKSVVFFSEGLPVSPVLSTRLDDLISAANRANITVYAVDAHGLRTQSTFTDTRRQMQEFTDDRLLQLGSGSTATDRPLTMGFERVEDMVRLDSRTGLARLADDTGGFLVENSNNLTTAFHRIDEDNQFHYLLTYSPSNSALDGKFRTIQVKVRRPGVDVFSRKGYRALAASRVGGMASYETPALALLDHTPLPNSFAVRASGFTFPDPSHPGLSPVLVHFRTDVLQFSVDSQRSTYSAQAIVVVRIRDGQGNTIHRLSQQYLLSGDVKDMEGAKRGDILFYRQPDLPPGTYTLEAIVFDAATNQGSVRLSTLNVPAVDASAVGMSSLVLVNRTEELRDPPQADTPAPLFVGRTLVYPNVGEPIAKSLTNELPFYFTLYGDVQGIRATVELLRDGHVLAERPLELPPASGGRTQHVGRLPIGGLPLGTYELRIRVAEGAHEMTRTAFFTLQE